MGFHEDVEEHGRAEARARQLQEPIHSCKKCDEEYELITINDDAPEAKGADSFAKLYGYLEDECVMCENGDMSRCDDCTNIYRNEMMVHYKYNDVDGNEQTNRYCESCYGDGW